MTRQQRPGRPRARRSRPLPFSWSPPPRHSTQTQDVGILLLAHGGSATWNAAVNDLRARVDERVPTEVAFGMATRAAIQAAVDRLTERGVREIVGVPLFISSHSSVVELHAIPARRPGRRTRRPGAVRAHESRRQPPRARRAHRACRRKTARVPSVRACRSAWSARSTITRSSPRFSCRARRRSVAIRHTKRS